MPDLVVSITLFILALIIGIEVIGKVPATLHTPLMSGANSIHGIVIVGVVIVAAEANNWLSYVFIFLAAVLGTMNVVGGYVVTDACSRCSRVTKMTPRGREATSNEHHANRYYRMVRIPAVRRDVRHGSSLHEFPEDGA